MRKLKVAYFFNNQFNCVEVSCIDEPSIMDVVSTVLHGVEFDIKNLVLFDMKTEAEIHPSSTVLRGLEYIGFYGKGQEFPFDSIRSAGNFFRVNLGEQQK